VTPAPAGLLDRPDRATYGLAMRSCRLVLTPAILCLAASLSADPVAAATGDEVYDIDMIVTLSGKCTVFRAAGQNLPCRAV
jgi:hypothetical protein